MKRGETRCDPCLGRGSARDKNGEIIPNTLCSICNGTGSLPEKNEQWPTRDRLPTDNDDLEC